jgi:ubiquinone/menaquinone biosynthesis C-methylase UbiE
MAPFLFSGACKGRMFHEISHVHHARSHAGYLIDPARQKISASWYDVTSADAWLQERTYEIADHLGGVQAEKWLTIGDGRFGLDSVRLMARGVHYALATDIDESLLKVAKARGDLSDYRVENAEQLSFQENSFDYVFCKEVLNQCPRPALALYEMLRVAKKGVILIEPNDRISSPARMARAFCKRLLGAPRVHMDTKAYAAEGNYIFSISRRGIEKIALAANIPQLAFKGLNDAYEPGLEFEIRNSARGRRMKRKVALRDMLCRLRLDNPVFLMAGIFHVPIMAARRASMEKAGWSFVDLPRNPYIEEQ